MLQRTLNETMIYQSKRKVNKMLSKQNKGKVRKVVKALNKASQSHKGQAKTLKKIINSKKPRTNK